MSIKKRNKLTVLVFLGLALALWMGASQKGKTIEKRERSFRGRGGYRSVNQGLPLQYKGPQYAPGQVLVKFKPAVSAQSVQTTIDAYESRIIRRIGQINVYQLQTPVLATVEEMVYVLKQNPNVVYAEPNYTAAVTVSPNDEFFWRQYALDNPGDILAIPGSPEGKSGADIKATAAWEETKGSGDIVIAVIDTGVDLRHPDIKNKILNSGRDFVNDDFDATDDHGHGTHVAGIAAAETNNSQGIAGVAWNCKVLPVKVVDKDGSGLYSWLIEGITWAADNGAQVINMSLGADAYSDALKEAVKYAYDKGLVLVAAAGNTGESVFYPAAFDDYCLAVAATDYTDSWATWSNVGAQIDVAAPGVLILSLVPTWYWGPSSPPYAFWSGTSMAAPHVAGLAALIKSLKPWLKPGEIMNVIRYSADDVNSATLSGKDDRIGYGRINMEKALVPLKIK
jgi:thermitase